LGPLHFFDERKVECRDVVRTTWHLLGEIRWGGETSNWVMFLQFWGCASPYPLANRPDQESRSACSTRPDRPFACKHLQKTTETWLSRLNGPSRSPPASPRLGPTEQATTSMRLAFGSVINAELASFVGLPADSLSSIPILTWMSARPHWAWPMLPSALRLRRGTPLLSPARERRPLRQPSRVRPHRPSVRRSLLRSPRTRRQPLRPPLRAVGRPHRPTVGAALAVALAP
jgi:hypothetical protein